MGVTIVAGERFAAPTTVAADGALRGTADRDHRCRGIAAGRTTFEAAADLAAFVVDSVIDQQAAGLPIGRADRARALETVGAAKLVPDLEMVSEPGCGAAAIAPDSAMAGVRESATADWPVLGRAASTVGDRSAMREVIHGTGRAAPSSAAGFAMVPSPATKTPGAFDLQTSGVIVHLMLQR